MNRVMGCRGLRVQSTGCGMEGEQSKGVGCRGYGICGVKGMGVGCRG